MIIPLATRERMEEKKVVEMDCYLKVLFPKTKCTRKKATKIEKAILVSGAGKT